MWLEWFIFAVKYQDMNAIVCPISSENIDSNVSRLTVFFNVVLMLLFILTLQPVFICLVAFDYFIRATLAVKYSPLRWFALFIINNLNLKKKPIGLAQKIFASRLGFLCAIIASILALSGNMTAATFVAGFLMLLSVLDSVFNFCLGCIIYNYLVYPFYKNR
jgi:hypothetical protein